MAVIVYGDQAILQNLPVVVRRVPAREGDDDVPSSQRESALREMRRQARGGLASVFGGSKRGPLEIVEERDAARATAETLARAVGASDALRGVDRRRRARVSP